MKMRMRMRIQDTGKLEICIDLVLLDELMLMQDASKLTTTSYEYTYVHYRTCMVHKEGNA